MAITRWQRGALRVNAHNAIDPEAHIGPLAQAGYKRVEVLTNSLPDHVPPVPRSWVDRVKKAGMANVDIVVWADTFSSPEACFSFCEREKLRLNANGVVVNAEDGWEHHDQATQGQWSERFLKAFRARFPALSLSIDTYLGCGGINLAAWQALGKARLIVQTHHEAELFPWSVESYVAWAKQYGWVGKAAIKPEFSVYKAPDGSRADQDAQVASAKAAGTAGFVAYYAEGALDANVLVPLLQKAKAAGVAH